MTVDATRDEKTVPDHGWSVRAHRFTVTEYRRMVEAGILREDASVELVRGQVIDLPRVSASRLGMVNRLCRLLTPILWAQATLSIHNPVQLDEISEPEPDITILKFRDDDYGTSVPVADDVLALIDVSDAMLKEDRGTKVPLYAEGGIPEYWVVDLAKEVVHVYREAVGGQYNKTYLIGQDSVLDLVAIPDSSMLAELLWR